MTARPKRSTEDPASEELQAANREGDSKLFRRDRASAPTGADRAG